MPHIPGTPKTKQGILRKIISKFAICKLKRWGEKSNEIIKIIPKFAILKSKNWKKLRFKSLFLSNSLNAKSAQKMKKIFLTKKELFLHFYKKYFFAHRKNIKFFIRFKYKTFKK